MQLKSSSPQKLKLGPGVLVSPPALPSRLLNIGAACTTATSEMATKWRGRIFVMKFKGTKFVKECECEGLGSQGA
jgi:hypothetical protein